MMASCVPSVKERRPAYPARRRYNPPKYAKSGAGSSGGSADSCSSYVAFGSRKGRQVAYPTKLRSGESLPLPPPREASPNFRCTFCGKGFHWKFAWQRHEEATHAPPKVWICEALMFGKEHDGCPLCRFGDSPHPSACEHGFEVCWRKTEKERTFFRADAFKQHLSGLHKAERLAKAKYEGDDVETAEENLVCPFCNVQIGSWKERVEHVAEHFKKGEELPAYITSSDE